MRRFTQLFLELDQTNKTKAKVAALLRYFEAAPPADKLWCIALLSGKRPKKAVRSSDIRAWTAELSGLPLWLFEETYHIVGDLAETIAKVLPPAPEQSDASLQYWMEGIRALPGLTLEERRAWVQQAWRQLPEWERFVFNKMMMGGYRMGVSQKLMVRALAQHTGKAETELAHRLMGDWRPQDTSFDRLVLESSAEDNLSRPYPFYLAYQLDEGPEGLGDPSQWLAERKWDGIRGQLIVRQGAHYLWSRGEELITEKFPEFDQAPELLPSGTVLDGEILPFKAGEILPFQELQTRIGRKNVSKKILARAPVVLRAYDLLEAGGEDLRALPQVKRREKLEALFDKLPAGQNLLQLSPRLAFQTWSELAEIRATSRAERSEGVMLKHKEGIYRVGRKKGDWWKWKVAPLTIDAVLIYAMRGHGRRANLYTDYTFAVWKGEELVPFTKAYSGLTDAEFRQVDAFVKKNTRERFGPVRSVKPELVFELAFEGIQRSSRHKSGVALRFPRMKRWRHDKPAAEANTLADLQALLAAYGS
ncbi:MAG: ATP-dependent DNA ligase [Schleiferiaceae bacterium]|nr:ATP-dependent DNA ligase [Schleiferiaceae bacterium]MDR9442885.1 ATP-dependent DNA ligase [Schleiferiaceae bacterium]